jgi:hypothetical protein
MCGNHILEQKFGRQRRSSGYMAAYDQAGNNVAPVYVATNWRDYEPELGNVGATIFPTIQTVLPVTGQFRYQGILPLTEQPKLAGVKAWESGVVV